MRRSHPFTRVALAAAILVLAPGAAFAFSLTFNIQANGIKEVSTSGTPGQGDLDGTAIGTLTLDNGTGSGTTGSATFSITLTNIDLTTLSGHHIHQAPATTTGSIFLDFGDPDGIRTGGVLSGTISGLNSAQITAILNTPSNFYYNIHNGAFPGGAVRDQLAVPEPSALALFGLPVVALLLGRRRR